MAKNKTSKFNVTDGLTYKETQTESENTQSKKLGRPPKPEKMRGYRYNLNLDKDLDYYLHEIAWINRTSMTQYINDLIRKDMESNELWQNRTREK